MKLKHSLPTLFFLFVLMSFVPVLAQEWTIPSNDPPYPCPYTDGEFYQPNLFPRYDINQHALVLVDQITGETVRVLDQFEDNVRIINWSPDCRYLSGAVGEITIGYENDRNDLFDGQDYIRWEDDPTNWWQNLRDLVLWDTLNGERTLTIKGDSGRYLNYVNESSVMWSPDSNYVLFLSGCDKVHFGCEYERFGPNILWDRQAGTASYTGAYFYQYWWDMERGWLWGSAAGGVIAYDLATGKRVSDFKNGGWTESRFVLSPDGTKVVVYGIAQHGSHGQRDLTIYDLATMHATSVNVEGFVAPLTRFNGQHPVALSADNRYLVVGYDALRVWDIQNLPENWADRLPIYRHAGPESRIWSVRFADWGVVETTSEEGIQRWDLHTGAYIP